MSTTRYFASILGETPPGTTFVFSSTCTDTVVLHNRVEAFLSIESSTDREGPTEIINIAVSVLDQSNLEVEIIGAAFSLVPTTFEQKSFDELLNIEWDVVPTSTHLDSLNIFSSSSWISSASTEINADDSAAPSWIWTTFADTIQTSQRQSVRTVGRADRNEIVLSR